MSDPSDQKNKRDLWLWGILVLAAAFRLALLSLRPPHSDEGVIGWFADQIIANGYYKYDPTNYHGPFHYYLVFFFKVLFGRSLWALRLPSAILGVVVVYLLAQFKTYVGRPAAYAAALWAAVSPGLVYFSRFTFDTDMLFFHVLAVLGYLRHAAVRDRTSLFLIGIGVAGMITVKEAWLLHLICFGLAVLCLNILALLAPSDAVTVEKRYTARDMDIAAFGAILIVVTFYSGFFMYTSGVVDLFKGFTPWFRTSLQGSGHDKSFFYWIDLLRIYEWPASIGLLVTAWWILRTVFSLRLRREGTMASLMLGFVPTDSAPLRLLGIYGFGLLLAYSIIPYKTPWLIVQFIWPFLFVCGAGLARLSYRTTVMATLAVLLAAANAYPSIRLNFFRPADEQEKYVYVQTFPALMEVYGKLDQRVRQDITTRHLPINIILKSNWPMPWLLGDFTQVGYHSAGAPTLPDAAFLLVDASQKQVVEQRLRHRYFTRQFRYSPYQEEVVAYFDAEVFAGMFDAEMPVFVPAPPPVIVPGAGLIARFYNNATWQGEPVFTKKVANIDWQVDDPAPSGDRPLPAPFGVIYSGELFVPESGQVFFYLSSDDGAELMVDGRVFIADLQPAAVRVRTPVAVTLDAGWHRFQLRYYDIGGGIVVRLGWKLPSMAEETIPPERFRITTDDTAT